MEKMKPKHIVLFRF